MAAQGLEGLQGGVGVLADGGGRDAQTRGLEDRRGQVLVHAGFDGAGRVTQGPAGAPLQHYAVTIAGDGTITIDGSTPVASDVRAAVPA